MRLLPLLVVLCLVQVSFAQDTLSVFFEFGKWRIPRDQEPSLEAIHYRIDLSALDSVQCIGMADSVGTSGSNLKLSAKRSREVANRCRKIFPPGTPVSSFAMGALNQGDRARNRRVDIVFHLKGLTKDEPVDMRSGERTELEPELPCYVSDCDLLSRCIVRTFMKGRREFVEVEIPGGLTVPNPSGDVIDPRVARFRRTASTNDHVRIKWSRKQPRNKRSPASFIASMPKGDFDRWGVLVQKDGDCVVPTLDTCVRVDHALMQELQYRPALLRMDLLHVRAPRRVIVSGARYFVGYDRQVPLIWEERKGRRKSEFYFARLPIFLGAVRGITREMLSCEDHCDTTGCRRGYWKARCLSSPDPALKFMFESGFHGHANDNKAYVTLGLSKAGRWSLLAAQAGVDSELRPLASVRYQLHFLEFTPSNLTAMGGWEWASDQAITYKYFRAYAGTEFRWRGGGEADELLEPNAHLGLAFVNEKSTATFTRIFAQLGAGADLLNAGNTKAYLLGNFGCMIRLVRFGA